MALKYVSTKENIKAFNKSKEFAQKIQDFIDTTHAY
jgi:hypothetical protein